ncbi:hypothetical protein NW762_000586 [Fusarium torreyae]|uniref:Phospholipase/carboxylesterase/thioesterase domain-containing protein n=1 Tax=Fusarium torreyae TaxID=1237075 RepID=A0A9W8SJR4_9HYPO|nr:hypothetical protein NW762_000586 [Fusarium torreyae]
MGSKKDHSVDPRKAEIHKSTIIWLHDKGSSGFGLYTSISKNMTVSFFRQKFPRTRHNFPAGPFLKNNRTYDWYDHLNPYQEIPLRAIRKEWERVAVAVKSVNNIVNNEAKGVSRANVVLVGIGQGCAIGLYCLMQMRQPIGAFFGLGRYMPVLKNIRSIVDSNAREANPESPLLQVDGSTTISDPFNNDHRTSFGLQPHPNTTFDGFQEQSRDTTSVNDNTTTTDHSTSATELSSSDHQAFSHLQYEPVNTSNEPQQKFDHAMILDNNATATCNDAIAINPLYSHCQTFSLHQPNPFDAVDWAAPWQQQRADDHDLLSGTDTSNQFPDEEHQSQTGLLSSEDMIREWETLQMLKASAEQLKTEIPPERTASSLETCGEVVLGESRNETIDYVDPEGQGMARSEPIPKLLDPLEKARREQVASLFCPFSESPADQDSFAEQSAVSTPVFLVHSEHTKLRDRELANDLLGELGFEVMLYPVESNCLNKDALDLLLNIMETRGIGSWKQ